MLEDVGRGGGHLGGEGRVVPDLLVAEQGTDATVVGVEVAFESVELAEVVVDAGFEGGFVGREVFRSSVGQLGWDGR